MKPTFVTSFDKDAVQWYQIRFSRYDANSEGTVFQEEGEGSTIMQKAFITDKTDENLNKQLWQFVGDEMGFEIVNKNGMYAYVDNGSVKTSTTSKGQKFRLDAMSGNYASIGSQFKVLAIDGNRSYINAASGVYKNNNVGIWDINDVGNSVVFVSRMMPVPKEKINMLTINFETEGEVADAPLTIALEGATDGASIMNTGSVSVLKNVYTGTEYTITATAKDGFEVKGFTVDGQNTCSDSRWRTLAFPRPVWRLHSELC